MADVVDLGSEIHAIDTRMSGYAGITSAYLIRSAAPCLVETGTASSADVVATAIADLGVAPEELATIVVTHIHLDHAGGVGDLAAAFPRAQIVVHEAGARHLVDPERLLSSARRVFGRVLDDVFGLLRPTGPDRITAIGESGVIDLGGTRRLELFHSPGHARHHLGLVDSDSGALFVGDAAGIHVAETGDLLPGTPPPDFNLDLALASLRRFSEVGPTSLLFSHFGPVYEPEPALQRAAAELMLWSEAVRDARSSTTPDLDHALAMVRERTAGRYSYRDDPDLLEKFSHLNSDSTNVAGISRWWDSQE
jgi:glyoxylase-like metal-dependent hydrolase (beta-lactamase superfamily II)